MAEAEGECIARVKLLVGEREAEALAKALAPDNLDAPPWMSVGCLATQGGYLECQVVIRGCGDPRRILSLRNTIDDILRAVKASLEAIGG